MIDQLFGSKTRVKLLQLFLSNPNRSFYVREITRKVEEQINSVRRELANMLSVGIITSDSSNNKLYYEVNQKYEHYEALRSIFGSPTTKVSKETDSESGDLVAQLRLLGAVELAFLSGVFTRDELAPVDILIVGDVNRTRLRKFIATQEQEEGRELRYSAISNDEFDYRMDVHDRFIANALGSKKTVLIDDRGIFNGRARPTANTKTKKRKKKK